MNENSDNLIGKCGFYCGSCPTYTKGDCSGCRKEQTRENCYTFDCVDNQKIDYCGLCNEFPCIEILTREKATLLDLRWLEWKKLQRDIQNSI